MVEPFHEAPWIARGEIVEPRSLNNLRGEWPCLPFGRPYDPTDDLCQPWDTLVAEPDGAGPLPDSDRSLHGFCSGADWSLISRSKEELFLAIDFPGDSPVERVTRTVRPVGGQAALDVSVEIFARRSCTRSFGFHPNFALRGRPGTFRIEPRPYGFGLTHPGRSRIARAKPNARFHDLGAVPLAGGGFGRFDRLPFAEASEDILQLCGIEGGIRLVDEEAAVAWELTWDTRDLPSCLLWMSNRGRQQAPWRGENLCVGVEPVASAFDLGSVVASARNPISEAGVPTSLAFEAGRPRSLRYRLAAVALT